MCCVHLCLFEANRVVLVVIENLGDQPSHLILPSMCLCVAVEKVVQLLEQSGLHVWVLHCHCAQERKAGGHHGWQLVALCHDVKHSADNLSVANDVLVHLEWESVNETQQTGTLSGGQDTYTMGSVHAVKVAHLGQTVHDFSELPTFMKRVNQIVTKLAAP